MRNRDNISAELVARVISYLSFNLVTTGFRRYDKTSEETKGINIGCALKIKNTNRAAIPMKI